MRDWIRSSSPCLFPGTEQSRNMPGAFTVFTTGSARFDGYADLNVPMLARMFDRRCRGYEAVGYSISLPASAVPGWPADVFLPSDPEWKRDYAATVRRLTRDSVDTPRANLFVNVAKLSMPEVTGLEKARSASEAFLYRRLESLPEAKGWFQLNVRVPVPFDGQSQTEIDFVNEALRIAIELDGSQHLSERLPFQVAGASTVYKEDEIRAGPCIVKHELPAL